ncbi:MAG: chemotaxis protein CheC [Dehalococcoidia bacterium]
MESAELTFWSDVAGRGMERAVDGLSKLCDRRISIGTFQLKQTPMGEIAQLMGGPEVEAVATYITISGPAPGHIMFMFHPSMALAFADILMGRPPGTVNALGEMEESALAELGNIMGSAFLTVLSDTTGLRLMPSPPIVLADMAGALLDVVAADILLIQDYAFIAETTFNDLGHSISGVFVVIPREDLMHALLEQMRAA